MVIKDFTQPEINYFLMQCNFTPAEREFFIYRTSGSTVDERIEELMNDFIYYFNSKDLQALQKVMKTIRRIISEIYHSANTREERDIILHELQVMQVIK